MASTLATLRTVITDAIGNSQTKATSWADRGLNYAQLLAALLFDPPELHTDTTLSLPSGGTSVSLATLTRLNDITKVYNTTNSNIMWSVPWERWYLITPTGTGTPKYYSRRGATMPICPTPTAITSLSVYYRQYPSTLSSATDTLSFDYHDPWIISTAMEFVWAFQEEKESVDMFKTIGDSIGVSLAIGTKLRASLEEGIRVQHNISGTNT